MQIVIDAKGSKLTDAMFAEAYRSVVPKLADAKHTSVRACPARLSELTAVQKDISDVVEIGIDSKGKRRAVAAPVTVHVDDGIMVIEDSAFDKRIVSFEVNGTPEVQIINLALSTSEASAEAALLVKQKADSDAASKKASDAALEGKLAEAREQGRQEALLQKAKEEGAASVAAPVNTGSKPS